MFLPPANEFETKGMPGLTLNIGWKLSSRMLSNRPSEIKSEMYKVIDSGLS